ncbi:MAG TPA: DUF4340 domain-containing protein [Myxococcota bacterium]|nr:DUF4340 domain-containing protein [Myxococcota bacterium]
MKRTNRLLTVLLAGQVVIFGLGYVFCGSEEGHKASRVLLLSGIDRDSIESLTIEDKDGKSIKLAHGKSGWSLPEHSGFPADAAKVDRILGKLLGMESVYVVSSGTSHHVDLEVASDKFRSMVTLEGPKSKKLLIIGKTGSDGYTNVRLDTGPGVYAIEDLKAWELGTRIGDWVKREYLDVEKKRLAKLEIHRGETNIVLERNSLAGWNINGQPADKKEADGLVDKAVKIEVSDVVGLLSDVASKNKVDQGKTPLTLVLSLATEQLPATAPAGEEAKEAAPQVPEINERQVIHLALDPDKDTNVYCYSDDSKFVVRLDKWRVKRFFEINPDKLASKK